MGRVAAERDSCPCKSLPSIGPHTHHVIVPQAYKHIFLGPSSVKLEKKTGGKPNNAEIANMTSVTTQSIAYVAVLVRYTHFQMRG